MIDREAVWGTDDCLLFAGRVVEVITGRDPVAAMRGTYRSAREAAVALGAWGSTRIEAARARFTDLGLVEVDASAAPVGALGLITIGRHTVAAARIEQGWVVRADRGFLMRRDGAVAAWVAR